MGGSPGDRLLYQLTDLPATLGTVFRATQGIIDHTSVLSTIELRWEVAPLTERDKAAADLGDVLTLATPRQDDPLAGVVVPSAGKLHPNLSKPSKLDLLHASQVAHLPVRNDQGTYDHTPPALLTSADVGDYIRARTAAWRHQRQRPYLPPAPSVGPLNLNLLPGAPARRRRRSR